MGAAVATVFSYLAWIIATIIISERLWKVGFVTKLLFFKLFLGCAFVAWFSIIKTDVSIEIFFLIGVPIAALFLVFAFDFKTRKLIWSKISSMLTFKLQI